jgi:hypothetical protein
VKLSRAAVDKAGVGKLVQIEEGISWKLICRE